MDTVRSQSESRVDKNYIFYVSDYQDVSSGHVWKMDAKQAMMEELQKNLPDCRVLKYTEYHGEQINADSVGIVFPSHMWGISLAVYSFLQSLKVGTGTYVYAVAIGEVLSGDVDRTADVRAKTLQQFRELFEKRQLGTVEDIYIRCIDYRRDATTTEERLLHAVCVEDRICDVMEGLLFYRMSDVLSDRLRSITEKKQVALLPQPVHEETKKKVVPMPAIRNLFLDDDLLSEVRICQAM